MNNIPAELEYIASHERLYLEEDSTITVGITHHTQELLGDIVFAELPEVGANLTVKEQAGVVESVRAASDAYAPVTGEAVAVNKDLPSAPETVNGNPYGTGWFLEIKPANPVNYDGLLTTEQYAGEVAWFLRTSK